MLKIRNEDALLWNCVCLNSLYTALQNTLLSSSVEIWKIKSLILTNKKILKCWISWWNWYICAWNKTYALSCAQVWVQSMLWKGYWLPLLGVNEVRQSIRQSIKEIGYEWVVEYTQLGSVKYSQAWLCGLNFLMQLIFWKNNSLDFFFWDAYNCVTCITHICNMVIATISRILTFNKPSVSGPLGWLTVWECVPKFFQPNLTFSVISQAQRQYNQLSASKHSQCFIYRKNFYLPKESLALFIHVVKSYSQVSLLISRFRKFTPWEWISWPFFFFFCCE